MDFKRHGICLLMNKGGPGSLTLEVCSWLINFDLCPGVDIAYPTPSYLTYSLPLVLKQLRTGSYPPYLGTIYTPVHVQVWHPSIMLAVYTLGMENDLPSVMKKSTGFLMTPPEANCSTSSRTYFSQSATRRILLTQQTKLTPITTTPS